MIELSVDSLARSVGTDRRRAMLALGMGGLAAALAGASAGSAKESAGMKSKKKCKRQQQTCVDQVTAHCAKWGGEASFCEEEFLPCCKTCDVSAGIICILDGYSMLG